MPHPRLLAAALAASLLSGVAGVTLWLNRSSPPDDSESAYWNGMAMLEKAEAEVRAAENRKPVGKPE